LTELRNIAAAQKTKWSLPQPAVLTGMSCSAGLGGCDRSQDAIESGHTVRTGCPAAPSMRLLASATIDPQFSCSGSDLRRWRNLRVHIDCSVNPLLRPSFRRRSRTSAASATTSARSSSIACPCSAITTSRAAHETQPGAGGGRTAITSHHHRRPTVIKPPRWAGYENITTRRHRALSLKPGHPASGGLNVYPGGTRIRPPVAWRWRGRRVLQVGLL
jgi:hypothetical protein